MAMLAPPMPVYGPATVGPMMPQPMGPGYPGMAQPGYMCMGPPGPMMMPASPMMMTAGPTMMAGPMPMAPQPMPMPPQFSSTGEQDDLPRIPDVALPPQPLMDQHPKDGPISVAARMQPSLRAVRRERPAPQTNQYLHQDPFMNRKVHTQPRDSVDICGWVMAADSLAEPSWFGSTETEVTNVRHHPTRMAFQCISGWTLLLWSSQDDFEAGIYGARRAPRPLAWFDLRRAWGINVDVGTYEGDVIPYRIVVNMDNGNYYFCVDAPEDVEAWYYAFRSLIQDAALTRVRAIDTQAHQQKRWPAACGIAEVLLNGGPIGDRALAVLFHVYDLDYDTVLRIGEIMVLIQELVAAIMAAEGRAEASDRNAAVYSARYRVPDEDLFQRAVQFRRYCDQSGHGRICKDDFILYGQEALFQALSGAMDG